MGQQLTCSYKIPEAFSGEHLTELDGKTQDNKSHTLPLTIEVEVNFPIFEKRTIMPTDKYISKLRTTIEGKEINPQTREIN